MNLIDRLHKKWLIRALKVCGGNKVHAAKYLGLSRRTVNKWEVKFGLRPPGIQCKAWEPRPDFVPPWAKDE